MLRGAKVTVLVVETVGAFLLKEYYRGDAGLELTIAKLCRS
jgi:hypothetical protein